LSKTEEVREVEARIEIVTCCPRLRGP
jgi:hypothetical protein